jgi:hypothetical protein
MRITVDGEPIDDPGRSSADVQRCTDVALERADIQFRFDARDGGPRLSVTADPYSVPAPTTSSTGADASSVHFRTYTNYAHFIERQEVRIFEQGQSTRARPLAVLEVDDRGLATWRPEAEPLAGPVRELRYVLRAYDADGRFDETAPQVLWIVRGDGAPAEAPAGDGPATLRGEAPILSGYGETGPLARNIPLGRVGTVEVHGHGIPPDHRVFVAGAPVPVDEQGRFVAEAVLPAGLHTVEVAVLDPEGNGELFLRDLELEQNDWFYTGIADLTFSAHTTNGPADALEGLDNDTFDRDSWADGRLAFYVDGRFGDDWRLTASADTREGPIEDIFSNFLDKSPEALFRRIDPDYYVPTFGDDGTVEETAPTSGKFYAKLSQRDNHAMWGNFEVGYRDNELAHVDRALYGGNLHYQTRDTTRFGERRGAIDGFAAEPGTVASREEFRGTGGSLYYLQRQDLLMGSERVRIEVRDKDSGLVRAVEYLRPTVDYDIDYFQGRILLAEPLDGIVDDDLLVRSRGLSGDEAWLVVQYEYTPGFDDIDDLNFGGQAHYWVSDFVRFGATANYNDQDATNSSLYAGDLTLRLSAGSWLKGQVGRSEGLVSSLLLSNDGGFGFQGIAPPALPDTDALAYRADAVLGFGDWIQGVPGQMSAYLQSIEAGYSAPGMNTLTDTEQFGGTLDLPVTGWLRVVAKADRLVQDQGLATTTAEGDVTYHLTDAWSLAAGVRYDLREDDSPVVPFTQEQGERTDAVVQIGFDPGTRWQTYGFAQTTVARSGQRESNDRYGLGGTYRVNDRLVVDGEASYGDSGPSVELGTRLQESERTERYLRYTLDTERAWDGLHERRGTFVSGMKSRLSDSSSVYQEDRYQHADRSTGLTRSVGISLAPTERWSFGANWETGTLVDRQTNAETDRNAGGARIAYGFERLQLSTGIEYRFDETEQPDGTWTDRTTWLFRNSLKLQMTPDWRLISKFNHSFSESSLGQFFDGGYTEAVVGYAYRPVAHDRLNALMKYTYFYNMPTTGQVGQLATAAQFVQKSHIASLDVTYDLTTRVTLGGKYAYRRGEVSLDRDNPRFFDNDAHLVVARGDWRFTRNWEGSLEGRMLLLPDLDERRGGALFTLYRYLGDHFKIGIGYNFTDFSDDLTDLSYDHHGFFINLVGAL